VSAPGSAASTNGFADHFAHRLLLAIRSNIAAIGSPMAAAGDRLDGAADRQSRRRPAPRRFSIPDISQPLPPHEQRTVVYFSIGGIDIITTDACADRALQTRRLVAVR